MATHREAPVLLGMPELVRRPLSAPAANKKKTQSLSASQRMSDELVKHVAAFNFGRNHLCTIYIEHCTRHRESFSLRGNLNKYEATAKWVVEQLLTHLGDGCKVNVHVNGITTREDFTLSVGERRWARMNDMSHEIHLGKLRPVMDGLWGKSETHRVPPSLKAIPGVHGAPSPSAELPRDFPRIGAFEVVLAITDCRLSDSAQPLFQALLCSKRDLTCWPSRDSLQSRLSKFMDRVGEALYLGTPPWPLGRAASSPDGPVAAPPPTSDEGKWMSLYHQFCHMEAHRNTWWLFDPLPMLADTENALDSVVSHSLKWSPRLGMTTLDTWRPEHLVRKALGSTELASDIAALLLRQLERRAQRVGQQCDAHLQYVFLRTIAVSGQSDDLVAALLRESPLELSGLVAKCLRDTIGPLNQSTNSSSIAAKVQDCVLDGARFFEVIEDDDKWPLLILSVFLSAPVELKIVLKGIFLFFKLSGSPLDAMELGVPELHIEAQGEEANRPLLRILFSISDDARRRTVLNLLKNAGADGFRTATQLPVDQRKPRYKIVEQKRDGEDQMKNERATIDETIRKLGKQPVTDAELVGGRLYTGPMFTKYNAVLRGITGRVDFFRRKFEELCQSNCYVTTIHTINRLLHKLVGATPANKLYRGINSLKLPEGFLNPDDYVEHLVRGGVEFGFMSATSDREVAVKYAGECKPSMLFEIEQGMADRAAALKWLSQYPHENELCFPPLCGLEVKVEEDEARTPMTRWDWLKEEKTCFIVRLRACVREVREREGSSEGSMLVSLAESKWQLANSIVVRLRRPAQNSAMASCGLVYLHHDATKKIWRDSLSVEELRMMAAAELGVNPSISAHPFLTISGSSKPLRASDSLQEAGIPVPPVVLELWSSQDFPDNQCLMVHAGKLGLTKLFAADFDFSAKSWNSPMSVSSLQVTALAQLDLATDTVAFLVFEGHVLDASKSVNDYGILPGAHLLLITDESWQLMTPEPGTAHIQYQGHGKCMLNLSWPKTLAAYDGVKVTPTFWEVDSTDVQHRRHESKVPRPGMVGRFQENWALVPARKCADSATFRVRAGVVLDGHMLVTAWSAASSSVINFMQLLKFCAEEKAKEMAAAVKQKLSMRTFDGELESYVSVLRSHKSYVPALCGTPWCDWSAPGSCQVCNTDVDCAEKGLHCEAGGHRICWACMVAKIEWHRMDPLELLTTSDDPGLLNRICHECGSEAATTDGYVWIDQEPAPL